MDYCGARTRMTLAKAERLGREYVVQPKIDGTYCQVHLDDHGRVSRAFSRNFREIDVGDIAGARIGAPGAVLVGELEVGTEAAVRTSTTRGHRLIHLFDCLRGEGGRYLAREPYRVRRDMMQRMYSAVVDSECHKPTDPTPHGRRDSAGRWSQDHLRGWERACVVEQAPVSRVGQLWADYVDRGGGEGLVVVNTAAPVGSRSAKRKIKAQSSIDCSVVGVDEKHATLMWAGMTFVVGRGKHPLQLGEVVEVLHDGWYESTTTPRFPRIVRLRPDLA